jgi:hypothetical protein
MDYRKLFKSKWFTAADIEDGSIDLTIAKVTVETVKNESGEEQCPTLHFAEHDKPLVLNKTNARAIAGKFGADADGWAGKGVTLRESVTTFRGEEVPCVRVK